MANEIQFDARGLVGSAIYATLRNSLGQVWNGTAFETLEADNWLLYDIALTDAEGLGTWLGTMPAVAAGTYTLTVYQRAGASPVVTDVQVGVGSLDWDGSAVVVPGEEDPQPGSLSGITLYAASADVEFVWSEFGVEVRLDDDQNGVEDTGLMNLALQKASLDVNRYLIQRYTVATISASGWARWATAYLAAEAIGLRRALPIPDRMAEQVKGYRDELQRIRESKDHLPGNEVLATPRYDHRPVMSNLMVDSRFGRYYGSKVRRVVITSVGPTQPPGLRRSNEMYPGGYPGGY